jgi:hypothetical protein
MPPQTRDILASVAACVRLSKRRVTPGSVVLVASNECRSPRWRISTSAAAADPIAAADGYSGIGGMKKGGGMTSGDVQSSGTHSGSDCVARLSSSSARRIAVYGRQKRKWRAGPERALAGGQLVPDGVSCPRHPTMKARLVGPAL